MTLRKLILFFVNFFSQTIGVLTWCCALCYEEREYWQEDRHFMYLTIVEGLKDKIKNKQVIFRERYPVQAYRLIYNSSLPRLTRCFGT